LRINMLIIFAETVEGLYIAPSHDRPSSFSPSVSSSSSSHQSSKVPVASDRGKSPSTSALTSEARGGVKGASSKSSQSTLQSSLSNGSNVPGSAAPTLSTLDESEYSNSDSHQSTLSSK